MNLEFSLVPYGGLTAVVPAIWDFLVKSEKWTRGRANIDDIVAFLYSGQMQLWMVYDLDSHGIYGHVITEVKQYPRMKMLVMQYIAAEKHTMQFVDEKVYPILEKYARDTGCGGLEAFGRPGWKPHMIEHGYQANTILYEKYFLGEVK